MGDKVVVRERRTAKEVSYTIKEAMRNKRR